MTIKSPKLTHLVKALLFSLMAVFIVINAAMANEVRVKGTGTIPYDAGLFSSEPDEKARNKAVRRAQLSAWKRYTANFNAAKTKAYRKIENEILGSLERYIIDVALLDEAVDKDAKTYSVVVRVTINDSAFNSALREASAAGSQESGEGSAFTFLFIARQAVAVKSYDAKRTQISQSESVNVAKEKTTVSEGRAVASDTKKSMTKSVSGGSTVRKADKTQYSVIGTGDIDTAVGDVLSTAGFEVVSYEDVVSECGGAEPDAIREEFSVRDSMTRKARKAAILASRECEVSYFAVATLDVGMQEVDPVTGNKKVFVSVRCQVWRITSRLPRKVASVGPIQFAGLGPNEKVARRNALIMAAKKTAEKIVDQLNAKGLR